MNDKIEILSIDLKAASAASIVDYRHLYFFILFHETIQTRN